ncbi:MAG: hypothetical protein IJ298_01230 [Ruminococcus sp.]|nr:hypothetical protein [Ruminococcus sp.]
METNYVSNAPVSAYRPKQVLLLGLGGVGGRIVNAIMSKVPAEFRPYTQAVAIDTDIGEMKLLKNIPLENQILLGANTTVGKYMRENPDVGDWMVKGQQLDLIRNRNTKNGAKQIRMVSRIALRATNSQGHLGKRIENAINKLNAVDGKSEGSGLLVLVVCSIAGGTGAGTVIQVPIYLEEAIKNAYDSDNVQFECAMLMPNAFSTTLSTENFKSGKVNGYAVLRELMSLNTGRMRRFEYFEPHEVDTADERCAPYGRVMLFDSKNGKGESITGAVDTVHAPLMADALIEYLFGPANGKITSALDNTLKRVYDTNGAGIFGAVGKADLLYPRVLYKQFCVANWINATLSDTWLYPEKEAADNYREVVRTAREKGQSKPAPESKYVYYNNAVMRKNSTFFNAIKRQLITTSPSMPGVRIPLAEAYWKVVSDSVTKQLIEDDENVRNAYFSVKLDPSFSFKDGLDTARTVFGAYYRVLEGQSAQIPVLAKNYMQPSEARTGKFYNSQNDPRFIYAFIKEYKLHPIALRCFLYDLYAILSKEKAKSGEINNPYTKTQSDWSTLLSSKRDRDVNVNDERNNMKSQATNKLKRELATKMLEILTELINEVEDLFASVLKVKEFFSNSAEDCLSQIDRLNSKADTVVVGSSLSMINCWNVFNTMTHEGEEEEDDIIDETLSVELAKLVYKNFFKHVDSETNTSIKIGDDIYRLPTDYTAVLRTHLQTHFMHKLTHSYGKLFPENVVEAVKYDCGVKNYWGIIKAANPITPIESLKCTDPTNSDYYNMAVERGLEALNPVDTLNLLLALAIGKSEPRCGFISQADGADYTNRYIVMNKGILQKKPSYDGEDSDVIEAVEDFTQIIPGVSTAMIEGINVNACFNGPSVDKITCLTSYAGLEPSNFVALLAPDSDENAPQDGMGYYKPYREYITEVVTDPTKITPHLDRRWHLADKLADITPSHTQSVWKHAAKAFVYGFAYDLIQVSEDGHVTFGEYNNIHFTGMDKLGTFTVDFISPAEQAELANPDIKLSDKKDLLNAILNKIFERLTNDPKLTTAIIEYAEEKLANDRMFSEAGFLRKALEDELLALSIYPSLLDVIDGYYNGSVRADHIEKDYAEDTTQYMFDILISTIHMQISAMTNAAHDVKNVCCKAIDLLYSKAVCDDLPTATEAKKPVTIKTSYSSKEDAWSDLDSILGTISNPVVSVTTRRPFSADGKFGHKKAYNLIDQLLRESEN